VRYLHNRYFNDTYEAAVVAGTRVADQDGEHELIEVRCDVDYFDVRTYPAARRRLHGRWTATSTTRPGTWVAHLDFEQEVVRDRAISRHPR